MSVLVSVIYGMPAREARIAEIKARLVEIDALGDSPRARRELSLGNTAWVAALDAEAATLRAELAVL